MNCNIELNEAIDVIEEILSSGGEFKFVPKGISMRPTIIGNKDAVVLEGFDSRIVKKYDLLFYRRNNGDFVLHRLMHIEADGSYTMCGDNQLVLEKGIKAEQVVGCVRKICKKRRTVILTSRRSKIYTALWCCMPIRWIFFLPRRFIRKIKRIFGNKQKKC